MVDLLSFRRRAAPRPEPAVLRASAEDVLRLPVAIGAHYDRRTLSYLVAEGRVEVWRTADFGGYAVARRWRGRAEIAEIVESSGSGWSAAARGLIEALRGGGRSAAVLTDAEVARHGRWYAEQGWHVLENLVLYEHPDATRAAQPRGFLRLERFRPDQIATVTRIDRAAFPWLWWNDPDDFLAYAGRSNVAVFLAAREREPVGYLGLTTAGRYGHIDRLAIAPARQGEGLGSEILKLALAYLAGMGCRRVGLSTQETNTRARRLYERYGFRAYRDLQPLWGETFT